MSAATVMVNYLMSTTINNYFDNDETSANCSGDDCNMQHFVFYSGHSSIESMYQLF